MRGHKYDILIIGSAIFALSLVIVKVAWICDDSYITFRVVDNFIHGYGLTWNTSERVQSYSNPLWMLLVSIFYSFTHEIYYTVLVISITVTIFSVILFSTKISKYLVGTVIGLIFLIFSKAFTDFSTSGLEDPLSFLILTIFFITYTRTLSNYDFKNIFTLSMIAALGSVNRLDLMLFFIPALIFVLVKSKKLTNISAILLGLLPIIAWEIFALWYYGFLFPNTAYAKVLDTGIAKQDILLQGLYYFKNSFTLDPLTLIGTFSGIMAPFIAKRKELFPISFGIVLYLLFIINMGGDFMSGRFFAPTLLVSIFLIPQFFNMGKKFKVNKIVGLSIMAAIVIIGLVSPFNPVISPIHYSDVHTQDPIDKGIADEREFYYQYTGLLLAPEYKEMPAHPWVFLGKQANMSNQHIFTRMTVGFFSFYAGPHVYVIDRLGLGDPLLSKMPTLDKKWRIGHFDRSIPDDYVGTITTGKNNLKNSDLSTYYSKLTEIIKEDLLNSTRIYTILKMNVGEYDYLLKRYEENPVTVNLNVLGTMKGIRVQNVQFDDRGLVVNLDKVYHCKFMASSLLDISDYKISFINANKTVGKQIIHTDNTESFMTYVIKVPEYAINEGYNKIIIDPLKSTDMNSIGYLLLNDTVTNLTTGTIIGTIYNDVNSNGVQNAGELGVSGVTVKVFSYTSNSTLSSITNSTGQYIVTNVPAGGVAVFETIPLGTVNTQPGTIPVTSISGAYYSDVDNGQTDIFNFGNAPTPIPTTRQ